ATVTAIGLPSIWLTINPPDTKSAILLKFASGDSIDLDDAFQLQLPTPNQRSVMVAKNPVAAARYFKLIMDSVFDLLVRTDRTGSSVGLFGRARAHYGTIE
ncbi:hypothetical protein BDY24DRAFT_329375, partial [Mrakia frigida]|uniref:uncharacterized protein n=1 Tax=Mrakia frigida TaxID=29902 RepID=UPI003FCC0EF9